MNSLAGLLARPAAEFAGATEIEGTVPPALAGRLFRVGPGRFGRADAPSAHALDGDGMIHRYTIVGGRINYTGRWVGTAKFRAEEAAGRSLYPTWSRKAPGWWRNVGTNRIRSQAGVTVTSDARGLAVRDEVGLPWRIDPDTLETPGELPEGPEGGRAIRRGLFSPKAHVKTDPASGETFVVGMEYGRQGRLHVLRLGRDGTLLGHFSVALPRQTYFHDFALTQSHVILPLPPLFFDALPFVLGLRSFTECLSWRKEEGLLWLFVRRDGTDPRFGQTEGAWTWHTVNAWEEKGAILVDWVGFDAPDHFIGPDAALAAIPHGEAGRAPSPGRLRRTRIDLNSGSLSETLLVDGNFEFPSVAPADLGRPYRSAFMTSSAQGTILADGIARVDPITGSLDRFHFGAEIMVSEPLPTRSGHVLATGLDAKHGQSFLAIFAASAIAEGPVARAWVGRPLPATFHGLWQAHG